MERPQRQGQRCWHGWEKSESGPVVEDESEIGYRFGEKPRVGRSGQAHAKIVLEVAEPIAK
jgi:hypothetical protein